MTIPALAKRTFRLANRTFRHKKETPKVFYVPFPDLRGKTGRPGIRAFSSHIPGFLLPGIRGLSLAPGIRTFFFQASAGFLSPRRPAAISGVPGADVCGRPAPSHGSPDAGAAG